MADPNHFPSYALELMPVPVLSHRRTDGSAPDHYVYSTRAEVPGFGQPSVAFWGVQDREEEMIPPEYRGQTQRLYVLSAPVPAGFASRKLSFEPTDGPFQQDTSQSPFRVYVGTYMSGLKEVYEHSAPIPGSDTRRYIYDFRREAHDGWSEGNGPLFFAYPPAFTSPPAENPEPTDITAGTAESWLTRHGPGYAQMAAQLVQPGSTFLPEARRELRVLIENMVGMAPNYWTNGVLGEAAVIGSLGLEGGELTDARTDRVLYNYASASWGFSMSVGLDLTKTFGAWFGDESTLERMQGWGRSCALLASVVAGVAVILVLDSKGRGVKMGDTELPLGIVVGPMIGADVSVGFAWSWSYTWFSRP